MAEPPLTVAKAPCKSCPYRKDVPSGVWGAVEYDKLPHYDGSVGQQFMASVAGKGTAGVFMCHQTDGKLCAGWVGCHGARNLLAFRVTNEPIADVVWDYQSPVPLFKSGAEAAAHGKRAIKRPGVRARRTVEQLLRKRRRGKKVIP